jgi:hypothetical protein
MKMARRSRNSKACSSAVLIGEVESDCGGLVGGEGKIRRVFRDFAECCKRR